MGKARSWLILRESLYTRSCSTEGGVQIPYTAPIALFRYPFIQAQAVRMMFSGSECLGVHFRPACAREASATSIGGSPARRGPGVTTISRLVRRRADAITSLMLAPLPVPRL